MNLISLLIKVKLVWHLPDEFSHHLDLLFWSTFHWALELFLQGGFSLPHLFQKKTFSNWRHEHHHHDFEKLECDVKTSLRIFRHQKNELEGHHWADQKNQNWPKFCWKIAPKFRHFSLNIGQFFKIFGASPAKFGRFNRVFMTFFENWPMFRDFFAQKWDPC